MVFAFYYIIRSSYKNAYRSIAEDHDSSEVIRMELSDQVTFLNKGVILSALKEIPENSILVIDGSRSKYIDHDVLEVIHEFKSYTAKTKNIKIQLIKIPNYDLGGGCPLIENQVFRLNVIIFMMKICF
ncbi:MAG: hypothetical protein R2852_06030 [Bacteroidia bacterium]